MSNGTRLPYCFIDDLLKSIPLEYGTIDQADYTIWADNYGSTLTTPPSNPVPEPTTLILITLTSFTLNRRRKQRTA